MLIAATIKNDLQKNYVSVNTEGNKKEINIPSKPNGQGSSVNGGELLFLSLATCFCNDTYREAARRNIKITSVEVTVNGEFGREGEAASYINYKVDIKSDHPLHEIRQLISDVDKVVEIQNTLRKGIEVNLIPA